MCFFTIRSRSLNYNMWKILRLKIYRKNSAPITDIEDSLHRPWNYGIAGLCSVEYLTVFCISLSASGSFSVYDCSVPDGQFTCRAMTFLLPTNHYCSPGAVCRFFAVPLFSKNSWSSPIICLFLFSAKVLQVLHCFANMLIII